MLKGGVALRPAGHGTAVTRRQPGAVQAQSGGGVQQQQELKLVGPEPQRFAVAKGQLVNIARAALPALVRLGSGALCAGYGVSLAPAAEGAYSVATVAGRRLRETSAVGTFPRPAQPLVLYEHEGCPFCRKVREATNILDLDVLVYPCPREGPNWRAVVQEQGGKQQYPYLQDPNTGVKMYESDDIINYLFEKYGDGKVPLGLRLGFLTALSCSLAMLPSLGKGSYYKASKPAPKQPLVFWGYEASPFTKIVREELSARELPHLWRSCARGSPKRQELFEKRGLFQAPYLEDPNTGVALFESAAIIEYLEKTYGA